MPTSKTKIITQTKKRKARGNKSSQEVYRVAVTVVSDVYEYFISKKIFLILGGGGGGVSTPFDAATLILFHIFFQIAEIPQGCALE